MTTESYAQLVSAPREFPPLAAPEFCAGLAALFDKACTGESQKVNRARTWTRAETELRQRFSGACPPSIADVLAGRVQSPTGFNELALQVCLLAHALGWDEDRLVTECAGLIAHHAGDGRRYGTPQKRENELRRMFDYTAGNNAYSFSTAGLRSILPAGSRSPDLQGLEADEAEDAPDYVELLDAADGDAGQVVAVARRVVADPSLSRTEAEALIKRAAKSAGVAAKVLRADLWQPDDAEGSGLFIDVHRNNYAGSVDSAMAALASVPSLRVRSGQLVEVRDGRIVAVQLPRLAYLLSSVARWRYPEGVGGPDTAVLQGVMAAGHWPDVPEIIGLLHQPTIKGDGTIVVESGNHAGLETVFDAHGWELATCSGAEAMTQLRGLLNEYPFATPLDEAAAMAAMLTAVCRPMLETAPGFMVAAHDLGTGKSHLAKLVSLFASGDVQMSRWPTRGEEQDKSLLSVLMQGRPVVIFDNLMRNWSSPTLAAVLTADTYSDRLLGGNDIATVSTRCLWLATGNNVAPAADLSRRVLTIELDAKCERPAERVFAADPVTTVMTDRRRFVMLALRALQDYLQSGTATRLPPLASYPEWSRVVRGAIVHYGMPDPVRAVTRNIEGDCERELLGYVLQTWHEVFGDEPTTLRDAVTHASHGGIGTAPGDLYVLMQEAAGERGGVDLRQLGVWLRGRAGQVVGGLRLVAGPKTRAGAAWQVLEV